MSSFHDHAAAQRGHIDRAQVLGAGLSQDQIQRLVHQQHWQRPQRGVYLTGSAPPTWEDRVRAACLAAGGDARAMGRTAARLHGLDGGERSALVELTVGVARGPEPAGVRIHRTRKSEPGLVTSIRGIPVSSIRQTLLDYAWLVRSSAMVERAVEDALRRFTDEGALRRFVASRGKGTPGVRALRAVLDERPAGRPARSGFEVIVLSILRDFAIPLPERRPLVAVPPDRVFELDLAYMDAKIDIEAMGKKWHSTASQQRADAERRRVLQSLGWTIIEVWWDEAIFTPSQVADRVRSARG